VKLIASVERERQSKALYVSVLPSLVSKSSSLGSVDGVFNAISIHGDVVGETVYIGPGAGRHATSSAVISDIVDSAKLLIFGGPEGRFPFLDPALKNGCDLAIASPEEVHSRYYVRMRVEDRPGVMAEIASILASREVSLASVTQKEVGEDADKVSLIITTHITTEKAIKETVRDLEQLDSVQGTPMTMPISECGDQSDETWQES